MNHDVENLRIVFIQLHDTQRFTFKCTCKRGLLAYKCSQLLIELFHCLFLDIDLAYVGNLVEILWNQVRDVDLLLLLFLFSRLSLV